MMSSKANGSVFLYQLRLKAAVTVMGDGHGLRAVLPLQEFFARAVPGGGAVSIDHLAVLFMTQVMGQSRLAVRATRPA